MAQAELQFDGKPFVPSKIAAKATGYTQDYIGQLARSASILSHRVGGLWYVNLEDLEQHKKDSEAYVPEAPKGPAIAQNSSIVMFDGREYVSSKRAAEITGYAQDYVGQLARSGKIDSRQMAERWYVSKEDLKKHKQEKDALLGAVQAQAVGVAPRSGAEESKRNVSAIYNAPLYTYVKEEAPELPRIPEKSSILDLSKESRLGVSDYEFENKESDPDAIHHIAIRTMHRDSIRMESKISPDEVKNIREQEFSPNKQDVRLRNSKKVSTQALVAGFIGIFLVVLAFGTGFFMSKNNFGTAFLAQSSVESLEKAFINIGNDIIDAIGGELTYNRK